MLKRLSFIILSTLFVTTLSLDVQAASRKRKPETDTNSTAPKAPFGARVRNALNAAGALAAEFWQSFRSSTSHTSSGEAKTDTNSEAGEDKGEAKGRKTKEEKKVPVKVEEKIEAEEKKTPIEITDEKKASIDRKDTIYEWLPVTGDRAILHSLTLMYITGSNYQKEYHADEMKTNQSFFRLLDPKTVLCGFCHAYNIHPWELKRKALDDKKIMYLDTKTITAQLPTNLLLSNLGELKILSALTKAITGAFFKLQSEFISSPDTSCNNSLATLLITNNTLHIITIGHTYAILATKSGFKEFGGLQDSKSREASEAARPLFVGKPERPELTPKIYSRELNGSECFILFVGQSFIDTYGTSFEEIVSLINKNLTDHGLTAATITEQQAQILVQKLVFYVIHTSYKKQMARYGSCPGTKLSLSVIFFQPKIVSSSSSSSSSTSSSSSSSSSSSRSSTVAPTVVTAALTPVTLLTTPPTLTTLPIPSTPSSSLSPLDRVISKIIDTKHCTKEAAQAHYDKFVEAARNPMTEKSEFEAALRDIGTTLREFQATLPVDDVD